MSLGYIVWSVALIWTVIWAGWRFHDLWRCRPIVVPDPDFPGRFTRCVSHPVRRTPKGWRRHGR